MTTDIDDIPEAPQGAESVPKNKGSLTSERIREIAERGKKTARERKRQNLLSDRQLTLWADAVRGAPNEIVRSALFTAKNRKQARENLKRAVVAVIGEGEIIYTGEELRQDDETVWLQLIHLARENGLATPFQFTPYSFCKALHWPLTGQSYDRLDRCMTRLQATSLKIASTRLGNEISLSMLPGFQAKRRKDGDGGLWTVRMHDELVFLFSEFQYTRVEWQRRLALPEGLATWLHAYYASHREPFPVKVETLAVGAGLMPEVPEDAKLDDAARTAKHKERLRDVKKLLLKALEALKEAGFLTDFEVTRKGLVIVRRGGEGDTRAPIY
jgi:hypothetical protein